MSNNDLTAFVEWWNAFVIRLAKNSNPDKKTERVAKGAITFEEPKSMVQYVKKYLAITEFSEDPGAGSDFQHVFITLLICSMTEPSLGYEGQCYNNILADTKLNGGEPEENEIYHWVDVFSWKGFIENVLPFMALNGLFLLLANQFAKIAYLGWYALFMPNLPVCVAGDDFHYFGTLCD